MSKIKKAPKAFVILKIVDDKSEKYYLMTDGTNVMGFLNVRDGLKYFEDGYKQAMYSGDPQKSASAAIHMAQFQPSVVALTNMKKLESIVNLPAHVMSLNSIAGFMTGIECNEKAKSVWESGEKPGL